MFLQTGYGLEGVLPDALCKRIIDEQIAPRFKAGDFDGGLTAGVQAILAATKGEYKGTGSTVTDGHVAYAHNAGNGIFPIILVIIVIVVIVSLRGYRSGGIQYWGGGWSGGGSSGGGFGGGGGFSGGGGSFGGGGAGGSW